MTRETAKELLPIIQAYAEGKVIQVKNNDGAWIDDSGNLAFNADTSEYRIKPEEVFRPYRDCDEMIADFKIRSNTTIMPLIWIKHKKSKNILLVTGFEKIGQSDVCTSDMSLDFVELFNDFMYLDGTPCGVKE